MVKVADNSELSASFVDVTHIYRKRWLLCNVTNCSRRYKVKFSLHLLLFISSCKFCVPQGSASGPLESLVNMHGIAFLSVCKVAVLDDGAQFEILPHRQSHLWLLLTLWTSRGKWHWWNTCSNLNWQCRVDFKSGSQVIKRLEHQDEPFLLPTYISQFLV